MERVAEILVTFIIHHLQHLKTALMYACEGHYDVVKVLIERGKAKDDIEDEVIMLCVSYNMSANQQAY